MVIEYLRSCRETRSVMSPITRRTLNGLNSLLLIIVEFALINHIESSEEACGDVNGQTLCYYKVSDNEVDWETAWQLCNTRNSTLPVIRNRHDQLVFERFLRVQMSGFAVWTSGTAGRDHWYNDLKWLDGRTYTGRDSGYMRHFYSDSRQTPSPYICQYRGDTCNYFNDTSNVRNGCVRYSTDRLSWYEARNQCLMSGGDLAVLDDYELDRIRHRGKWIGLRRKSWHWTLLTKNKTASEEDEIKWTNWSDDWNTLNGECISIDARNGKWKAIRCSEQRRVVCQAGLHLESVTLESQTVATITQKSRTVASITRKSVSSVEEESQSVSYSTFITVVIIGICVIAILIFVVALIVRKYVYRRNVHVASRSEAAAAADKSYQDLETTRRQAKPENTYTALALQPVYEEVCERWK